MRLESTRLDIINYYDKIKFAIDTHVETLLSSNLIETNSKNHFTTLNLYRDILIKQVDIILSNNLDKNQKGRAKKFCIFIPNNNNLISKYFDSENKLGKLLILNQPVNQNVIQYLRQILNTEPPSETNYSQYFSSIEDQITTMLIMSLYTNRINGELIVDLTQENKIESFRINGNYTVINENWSHAFDSLNFDLINLKALTLFNFRTFNFTMLNFQNLKELKLLDLDLNEPFEFKFKNLEKLESLEIRLHKNKLSIILGYNNFINLKNLRNLSLSNFNLRSLSGDIFNGLNNLEKLNLNGNKVQNILSFPQCFQLKFSHLDMSNSSIQQINNSSLGLLKNLEFINLENNDLTCLGDCLNDLNNLKYLNLSGNCLNKINLNLENLEYLNLGKYQVVYLEQETFNLPRLKFLILNTKKLPKYLLRASELQRLEVYGLNSLDDYIFTNEHISSLDYLSLDFSIDQNISSFSKATFQGLNNLKLFRMSLNLEENSQMTNGFVNLFDQLMATKSNDVQPKKFIQFRNNRQFCIQISQIKSENNYLENILNVSQSVKRILIKNVSN